jgi:hypothetical protein
LNYLGRSEALKLSKEIEAMPDTTRRRPRRARPQISIEELQAIWEGKG